MSHSHFFAFVLHLHASQNQNVDRFLRLCCSSWTPFNSFLSDDNEKHELDFTDGCLGSYVSSGLDGQ